MSPYIRALREGGEPLKHLLEADARHLLPQFPSPRVGGGRWSHWGCVRPRGCDGPQGLPASWLCPVPAAYSLERKVVACCSA